MKLELKLKDAWGLQKVHAYSEIMLCVEDEPCVSIMGTQDPKAAWEKLDRIYSSKLANNWMMLISELVKMHYNRHP
jgi:hypothetical protein